MVWVISIIKCSDAAFSPHLDKSNCIKHCRLIIHDIATELAVLCAKKAGLVCSGGLFSAQSHFSP